MHVTRYFSWRVALALVVAAILPVAAVRAAPALQHSQAPAATCAALGVYQVGPRVMPLASGVRQKGVQPPATTTVAGSAALVWPYWALRGQLVISSYSGCGSPTAGTFAVRRWNMGPPLYRQSKRGSMIVCRADAPCWWPATGVMSATGSFAQDTLHPSDPTYVTVSATITTSQPGPQLGMPCSQESGCPGPVVMTSTVTFSSVTGYLQVTGGDAKAAPAAGSQPVQMATLSFLPPPAANTTEAPSVMTLQGVRGQLAPAPVPQP